MIMTNAIYRKDALMFAIEAVKTHGNFANPAYLEDPCDRFRKEIPAEEIIATLEKMVEQLDKKKNYKSNKPSKAQVANAELADKVAELVAEKGAVTCAEVEEAFGLSNQKASAILNRSGKFVKTPAKGKVKATWSLAE